MDLTKIAYSENTTYLEKTAAFADLYAEGVSGEEITKVANSVGVEAEDILSLYNIAYGAELSKTAEAEAHEDYLTKTAQLAVAYNEGTDEYSLLKIAHDHGIEVDDINYMHDVLYGYDDLGKTAAYVEDYENQLDYILRSETSQLTKIAAVADAYNDNILDGEDAYNVAVNYGVDVDSINEVLTA